jgi:hypothetical protein
MAGPFLPSDIDDLALSVMEGVQTPGKYTDISLPDQNYVFSRFMEEGKLPLGEGSGTTMTFRIQYANTSNARITGMFDTNNTGRRPVLARGEVKYSKVDVSYTWDVDEPEFQTDDSRKVVDYLKLLMHVAWNDFYKFCEELIFAQPSGPDEVPFGILGFPHWLVLDTASSEPSFTGGNPSGFTSGAAGLSSSTYEGWDNLTWGFSAINWDFVDNLFTSFFKTNFVAPHKYPKSSTGKSGYFIATTLANINALRALLRGANESYGKDVMGFANVMLNSQEIEPSAYLTRTSTNNIFYAINKAHLGFKMRSGGFKWLPPVQRPDAYSVRDAFMPVWFQGWCDNRREAGFVCAQA